MDWFVAFKYLHIVAMFFAVALAISGELVLRRVASSGDPVVIRTTVERIRPLGNLSTVFFLAGLGFGIVTALSGQMNVLAPWLILSYAAFVAAMLIGIFVTDPWARRLETAAANTDDGGGGLRAVISDPVARVGTWALMALIATLVFLMVVKPFA